MRILLKAAFELASKVWNKPITLGTTATVAAIPLATAVVDHETGGALSYTALKTVTEGLKEKIKNGASPEEIEGAMNTASYIAALGSTFEKGAQNLYVDQRMMQKEGPEAIAAGKRAAVEFLLLPDNMAALTAKHYVRTAIADDLFKGDRAAADKYIADSLVDDIVEGAQVIPLQGNQVGRDDVKTFLSEALNNPEQHPLASRFLSGQDRLMNGLTQIWPDLKPSTTNLAQNGPSASQQRREREEIENGPSGMDQQDMGVFKVFAMFLMLLLNMLGGKGLSSTFKRAHEGAGVAPEGVTADTAPQQSVSSPAPVQRPQLTPAL